MPRQAAATSTRTYGKRARQPLPPPSKAERLFAELKQRPPSPGPAPAAVPVVAPAAAPASAPPRRREEAAATDEPEDGETKEKERGVADPNPGPDPDPDLTALADRVAAVEIKDTPPKGRRQQQPRRGGRARRAPPPPSELSLATPVVEKSPAGQAELVSAPAEPSRARARARARPRSRPPSPPATLRTLTWAEVCPPGDTITKIAEASFAEIYRVTNRLGTSIIKVIRLPSPLRAQTAAQVRSGLVDEEPHPEADVAAELQISEWLAAVPGFVVYKERYAVEGRATAALLDTHRRFHARARRRDPDRLQFYPSPTRYQDGTRFLVVELGDAGVPLEDTELAEIDEVWDVFLLVAAALARAEEWAAFEHRDLHEGNICVRRARPPRRLGKLLDADGGGGGGSNGGGHSRFGRSGLDITILDYGISRASDPAGGGVGREGGAGASPLAFDLERDLSLFTSTHAPQCVVYRRMRSYLLTGERPCLPPSAHDTPYARATAAAGGQPVSWAAAAPYTNVLWLAYLYGYLVGAFVGARAAVRAFRRETEEMWRHLDPDAGEAGGWTSFGSAAEVVRFAVEAGWITEAEVVGGWGAAAAEAAGEGDERSILGRAGAESGEEEGARESARDGGLRRSPRKKNGGGGGVGVVCPPYDEGTL